MNQYRQDSYPRICKTHHNFESISICIISFDSCNNLRVDAQDELADKGLSEGATAMLWVMEEEHVGGELS